MDSIVIDTLESAKGCLKYLKNERIGQETFLPLDNLKKFEISAVVSKFAESYKVPRLIDVLAFESQYTNLFAFICKDTIVCEDSEFARKLAYESSESNKVIKFRLYKPYHQPENLLTQTPSNSISM